MAEAVVSHIILKPKIAACNDCGQGISYRTCKPLRCTVCKRRLRSAYSIAYGKRNRAILRVKERAKYHAQAVAEGRQVRKLTHHEDQSPEAKRRRQAETCRRYRERHPEERRKSANEWAKRNRQKGIDRFRERYSTDAIFNLAIKVRRRIHMALRSGYRGTRKAGTIIELLGCTYEECKLHIERQFLPGMTWEACFSGDIHFDHIRPCSSFDLSDLEQQKACFHFTNLQPLWAEENIRKHGKMMSLI